MRKDIKKGVPTRKSSTPSALQSTRRNYSIIYILAAAGALGIVLLLTAGSSLNSREADSRLDAVVVTISELESRIDTLEAKQVQAQSQPKTVEPVKEKPAAPIPTTKPKAAPIPTTKPAQKSKAGTYKITFYCPCAKCCGKSNGITASGVKAAANRTVAAPKNFAFGDQIRIEGLGHFVVEDRGGSIKGNRLDVFVDSHEEALKLGVQHRKVEMVRD